MSLKQHNFNIRFYSASYEDKNYNFRALVNHFDNDKMPVIHIGNYARRISIFSDNSGFDNSISGYFSTFREDIFHKGNKKTGLEELLDLNEDESIIERNYFILFYEKEKEILLYQSGSLFGTIKNFNDYLTNLTERLSSNKQFYNISMYEIGAEDFMPDKNNSPIKRIEYKISRPHRKTPRPGEDPWVQKQFDEMKELGVSTKQVIIQSKKGLLNNVSDRISTLLNNDRTRTLKVTLHNTEQPIDLLHNVLKDRFSLTAPSRKEVDPIKIFSGIHELKERHDAILKPYLNEE